MTPEATYVLPIRCAEPHTDELTTYLRWIGGRMPLVIVDGSPAVVFDAAHQALIWLSLLPLGALAVASGRSRAVVAPTRWPHRSGWRSAPCALGWP